MEIFIYTTLVLVLVGCAVVVRRNFMAFRGQNASEYVGLGPDFDLATHLGGRNVCEGVIFGPTGRVSSRFRAIMTGNWDGREGMLEVDFDFDGGATQNRAWHLTMEENGAFRAEAEDIEGIGRGRIVGPAVQLRYRIILPEDAGGHRLSVIDWMYLTEAGTIVNRSQFRKFGVLVAELMATIRKDDKDKAA